MTALIVVVDDQPLFCSAIADVMERGLSDEATVLQAYRPRELDLLLSDNKATHAIVDLSFGPLDLDAPDLRAESENGVDALLRLDRSSPGCRSVVVTAFDAGFVREAAVAIRQTWPDVAFLSKQDPLLESRLVGFVNGDSTADNAELSLLIGEVAPLPPAQIAADLKGWINSGPVIRLILHLADLPEPPTRVEPIAQALGWSQQHTKNLLGQIGPAMSTTAGITFVGRGLEWWGWARPRRGLLRSELLRDVID